MNEYTVANLINDTRPVQYLFKILQHDQQWVAKLIRSLNDQTTFILWSF